MKPDQQTNEVKTLLDNLRSLKEISEVLISVLSTFDEIPGFLIDCGIKKEQIKIGSSPTELVYNILISLSKEPHIPRQFFIIIEKIHAILKNKTEEYHKKWFEDILASNNSYVDGDGIFRLGIDFDYWIDKNGIIYEPKCISDKVIGEVTFDEVTNEIKINDVLLSRPNLHSQNEIAFDYIFKHPNKVITRSEIRKETKNNDFKKSFSQIVKDLGFNNQLKKMFFPSVSNEAVKFINPVTKNFLQKNEMDQLINLNIEKIVKDIKKKRKTNKKINPQKK